MKKSEIQSKRSTKKSYVKLFVVLAFFSAFVLVSGYKAQSAADKPLYKDPKAPVEKRVEDLLPRLTLEEKLSLIHGDALIGTSMDTAAIERLGIPRFSMTDGPNGARWGESTAFPTGVNMASTWNEPLIKKLGVALARETLAKGRNVILGPCICIHRVPFGGRNFESFSEDPYLTSRISVGYIQGVQSMHVVATPKHYAANNQEIERGTISVEIDERTLQEIYLPHFKASVQEGGALAVMCSYNKINGVWACENKHMLEDILKKDWGYKGLVMSDWGAAHSTLGNAMNGLDIEMPTGAFMGEALMKEIKAGNVPVSVIDEKVRRNLRVMFLSGIFDGKSKGDPKWTDDKIDRGTALDVARESIILLKNNGGILPLKRGKIKNVAIIGPNAAVAQVGGGGSSAITPIHAVSPLEGLTKLVGKEVNLQYALGCDVSTNEDYQLIPDKYLTPTGGKPGETGLTAKYFNKNLDGEVALTRVEKNANVNWRAVEPPKEIDRGKFAVRWLGKLTPPVTGTYKFVIINNAEAHFYINGKAKITSWAFDNQKSKSIKMDLEAGKTYDIKFEYISTNWDSVAKLGWVPPGWNPRTEAADLAAKSDVAIVFAGIDASIEGEGHDHDIELPGRQNELIKTVVAANPKTIVVLIGGTPFMLNQWLDKVPVLVEAWYPGEEMGTALAEILFGDVNPSGKLTITWPNKWEEMPAYGNYPGKDGKVYYAEGIFNGYRYYDTKGIKPLFPFGFGLSYTTFQYSGLKLSKKSMKAGDKIQVSFTVKNTGKVAGKEAVQLYISDLKSSVPRPVQELKGISKVSLKPGESKKVVLTIDKSSLSFFDPNKNKWVAEPGQFEVRVGASSRDIRLKDTFTLK